MSKPVALVDFASVARKNGPKCWLCSLPPEVRAQVVVGREKGITQGTIVAWLKSLGHTSASVSKISHHLNSVRDGSHPA